MDSTNMGGGGSDMDIQSILTGTSDTETTPGAGSGESSLSQQQPGGAYSFAGRTFKGGQKEAEAWANKVYGQSTEQKGILNWLKTKGFKDPALLEELAKDPEWADMLGKLGVEFGAEEARNREEADSRQGGQDSPQSIMEAHKEAMAGLALDREEMSFERKLGRPVTEQEHNAVMGVIERAPSLSYAEAWKLANHDRLLKEAAMRSQQQSGNGRKGNRPPPIPGVPGVKMDLTKPITSMNREEWRQNLKNSDEFRNLMSRE